MRKVLIITYYWPPAGGPGVQRWLKFVKYLSENNVEPIVYIPENPNYPIIDTTFVKEVPAHVKIVKQPINEPYKWAQLLSGKKAKQISSGIIKIQDQSLIEKLMLWVRGNFYIPDARKNWIKPSVKYLENFIKREKIDTIITTGPPHSVHLIGYELKEMLGMKWLADFRDPWTSIGYHKKLRLTESSVNKHKRLEKQVLNNADQIIVTSSKTKEEFQVISNRPIAVITNGYDSNYDGGTELDDKFTISHIGSLLSGRNPNNLWKVLADLVDENNEFSNNFKLQLAGAVSDDVLKTIYSYGLKDCVELLGYITHEEAVKLQQKSQVLLLVEIDSPETVGILPGKLYEYMVARRPILAVGPEEWEAGILIEETKTGFSFDYQSQTNLKNVILKWFNAFKNGTLISESKDIERYSRRELTKELSKLI